MDDIILDATFVNLVLISRGAMLNIVRFVGLIVLFWSIVIQLSDIFPIFAPALG